MIEAFIKIFLYVAAGFALIGATLWYVTSVYEEIAGTSDVVILPFAIADSADETERSRGEALARMLQARLQEIEHDLSVSQESLMGDAGADGAATDQGAGTSESQQSVTSIAPQLFATHGVSLQTQLLEPAQVTIAVGGVDVGGILPWLQRLFVRQRMLELTYYETPTSAIVSGTLDALGFPNEGLRVPVTREEGKAVDLDQVAWVVATEIERRRLARDPSNRVEALTTAEFGELISALNEIARLNRQTELGRPARKDFATVLTRLEQLAGEVQDWRQLQILVANVAESADKPDRALIYFQNALDTIDEELEDPSTPSQAELRKQQATLQSKVALLQSKAPAFMADAEGKARTQIEQDSQQAIDAYNDLFELDLQPLPLDLLPGNEANAYTDGNKYSAPAAVAQLPEITWHNMSWLYINKHLPMFGKQAGKLSNEGTAVAYAYSDILPMLIRQSGLVESKDPQSWDIYAGAVA